LKAGNLGEIGEPCQRFFCRRGDRTCANLAAVAALFAKGGLVGAESMPPLSGQKEILAG
jgi:hypothetical protein